jgi:hypothetical protein
MQIHGHGVDMFSLLFDLFQHMISRFIPAAVQIEFTRYNYIIPGIQSRVNEDRLVPCYLAIKLLQSAVFCC